MKSPAWQHSAGLIVLALFFLTSISAPLEAADKKPASPKAEKGKTGKGKKAAEPDPAAAAQDGLGAMGEMIPEGMRNLKVRIPGFQEGRQSSLITASAVTRQPDQTLFAEKLTINMYAVKPEENVRVDLRTATYDMKSQVLTSKERSRVSRSDFQIEGDSMVFDTTTSQGKMVGHVHMIIYDSKSLQKGTGEAVEPDAQTTLPALAPAPLAQPQPVAKDDAK